MSDRPLCPACKIRPTRNWKIKPLRWHVDKRPYPCTKCTTKGKCHGDSHSRRCRPGRPLCRAMRLRCPNQSCICPAYHFPHRKGGGLCGRQDEVYGAALAAYQERERERLSAEQ